MSTNAQSGCGRGEKIVCNQLQVANSNCFCRFLLHSVVWNQFISCWKLLIFHSHRLRAPKLQVWVLKRP